MTKIRAAIIFVILVLLTSCTATTQVKHKTATSINDKIIEIDHSYESLLVGYWYQDEIGIYTGEYNTQDEQEIANVISMLESSTIIEANSEIDIDDNMAWLNLTSKDNSLFIGVMESGIAKVDNEYFIKLSHELLSYLDKHNVYEAVREAD